MNQDEQWLLSEKYGGVETPDFFADKARLNAGEPLAYVIGHVPFLNTTIYLDSKPLIPRPETEFWVEHVITIIRAENRPVRVLDLCAGSGAIGVAVAKTVPNAHVTFGEVDGSHLPTIAKNLDANDIPCTRYQVFRSDLFENISGSFDYILCNPPYIDPMVDRAEASVKAYEPHLALYGGEAGMELIACIINDTCTHLTPEGELWLEHEPEQTTTIHDLAQKHGFGVETRKDQYAVERFSILRV